METKPKRIIVQTTDRLMYLEQVDENLWLEIDQHILPESVRDCYYLAPPRELTSKELEWVKEVARSINKNPSHK